MKGKVQLPNEQLIDYMNFCKAIAEGICPADEKEREGIDCIVGKQITVSAASIEPFCQDKHKRSYGSSVSDRPRSDLMDLYEACISYPTSNAKSEQSGQDFSMPFKLTDEDREWMEKLLPTLPSLKYPLSEKVAAEFMEAYFSLPDRPEWRPLLITTEHVEKLKEEQYRAVYRHQNALVEELALGRLVAVTADHVQAKTFVPGVFIQRKQAVAYLERCGISQSDEKQVLEIGNGAAERKLESGDYKAIVEYRNKLFAQGVKNFVAQTASKFGISPRYVNRIVLMAKADEEARSLRKNKAR